MGAGARGLSKMCGSVFSVRAGKRGMRTGGPYTLSEETNERLVRAGRGGGGEPERGVHGEVG